MPPALLAGGRQPFPVPASTAGTSKGLPVEQAVRRSGQVTATNISHELPWLQVGAGQFNNAPYLHLDLAVFVSGGA